MDFEQEYKMIGGIEQYILHYPVENAPVLLLLHGGPGSAESNLSYMFRQWWGDMFQIVQWDQRGSGKTLHKNPDISKYPLNVDVMLSDVDEVVDYLRAKYKQDKIVLFGHSWGTFLGTQYLQTHSEKVSLYIAVGQVVNFKKNERMGYDKAKETALKAGDTKSVEELNALGEFPPAALDKEGFHKIVVLRKVQQKYGMAVKMDSKLIKMFTKSPVFKFSDLTTMMFKANKVNLPLAANLMECNFEPTIHEYPVPVCSIQGENDYQTVTSLAVDFFEKVNAPAKQIHVIKNAGHNTPVDQPELFAEALRQAKTMIEN